MDFPNFDDIELTDAARAYGDRVRKREQKQAEIAQIEFEQSAVGKLFAETQRLRQDLEQQRSDEAARQKAQHDDTQRQAALDRKKDRLHDYMVAIFSAVIGIAVTLIVEHFTDIIAFFSH